MLAALHIDPLDFLRTEDRMEVMAFHAVAEGANEYLNKRDAALARAIGVEVGRVVSRAIRSMLRSMAGKGK